MAQCERDLQTQVADTARLRSEKETLKQALRDAEDTARKARKANTGPSSLADGSDSLDNPVSV